MVKIQGNLKFIFMEIENIEILQFQFFINFFYYDFCSLGIKLCIFGIFQVQFNYSGFGWRLDLFYVEERDIYF